VIRAVIFDFGGVLCFHPEPAKIARAAQACGMTVERFWEAFWAPRLDYDAGRLEPAEYWRRVLGRPPGETLLAELIRHEVGFWNAFDARVLEWIGALRAAGVRTAILSNLPRVLGEALRVAPGFLDRFDHVTFSCELRAIKPEPRIYAHAIEGLGVAAREALFVDDKAANVEGARAAGLRAELFTTWEDWIASGQAARFGLPAPLR
jgi:putative hydrolase of the HAD superfamily